MKKEISEKLKTIIKSYVNSEDPSWDDDADLEQMGINSISFIKIIVQIEMEFDIEFDQNDLRNQRFETLADMVLYVESTLDGRG